MQPEPCTLTVPNKYRCSKDKIKYDDDVEKFASSSRNKNVAFIKRTETFQYVLPGRKKPITAKGITKIIRGAYYDNYKPVYTTSTFRKNQQKKERERNKGKSAQQILVDRVRDKRLKGFSLGTTVHEELCDWARMKSKCAWKEKHPTPNTYTIKVIRALYMMKLEPLFGEWSIYDEHIPYATSIDMVCASGTEKGRLVLVELKTGYQGYFNKGNEMMTRSPLKMVPNSPLNQAYIQCLMAKATLERHYNIHRVYGLIIRVHERGVKAYPIPDEFLRRQNSIYSGVKDYMTERFPTSSPESRAFTLRKCQPTQRGIRKRRNSKCTPAKRGTLRQRRK